MADKNWGYKGSRQRPAPAKHFGVYVDYTNHRGERRWRHVAPRVGGIFWGFTRWHPQTQWLLPVYDYDKKAWRDLAMSGIHEWRSSPPGE